MNQKEQDKVIAFDTLFTTNHINMLKIIMSYFDSSMQKNIAIYIKYLELQYTFQYFNNRPYSIAGCRPSKETFDIPKLCDEVLPYCTKEERSKVDQIKNLMSTLSSYQEMSQTFEMMKDLFPEGASSGFDPTQMFDLFAAMNSQDS